MNFIDPYGLWSLSIEGYYVVGGGASISYNNGTLEVTGKLGVGLGAWVGLDPNGKPSKHALDCGSCAIARTSSKLEMWAGIG
ncbi:RHS repeat-associated core domain-containing protein, partial [Acinetobacter baumannii]|nr:RHS repeat-associated core domain-containing protein [Acinetobacter baumannii]